jgi:hypothetical protein
LLSAFPLLIAQEFVVNVNPLCSGGQFGPPKAALVQGDYKLLCYCFSVEGIDNATSTGCQDDPDFPGLFPLLYNITADPSETTNLASQFPDVVKSMEARLGVLALESVEPMQVRLCAAMGKKGKGEWRTCACSMQTLGACG